MKVGSIVYATDSGLGILARAFVDHGVVTDVMVVRHGRHPTHEEWHPHAHVIGNLRDPAEQLRMQEFCRSMDAMLFFETPFNWHLLPFCRAEGVKTAVVPMHECMPERLIACPDLWLCPSELDLQWAGSKGIAKLLTVPVDVPWRLRERAEVFIHNAGHGGLKGRNGTAELLQAIPLVKSPARFIVRTQGDFTKGIHNPSLTDDRVQFVGRTVPAETLWDEGDVFVFPEKFNGLSLPLQEARAAGMLVIATDRFPNNTWLPREPLVPTRGTERITTWPRFGDVDSAIIDPKDIAARIDEWYGRDITQYSLAGRAWAEENSWEVLGPKYRKVLEELVA